MSNLAENVVDFPLLCNSCKEMKSIEEFKNDKRRQFIVRGGKHTTCKDCENKNQRNRYEVLDDSHPLIKATKKSCTCCKEEKSLSLFRKDTASPLGRSPQCKRCLADKQTERRRRKGVAPQKKIHANISDKWRYTKFGLSASTFKELFDMQGGTCDICKNYLDYYSKSTCVDHNHQTGMIRGILCSGCNSGIGFMRENKDTLASAIKYLDKHQEKKE